MPCAQSPLKAASVRASSKHGITYTESEHSSRIRTALRKKVRTNNTVYRNGDVVWYNRKAGDRAKGPAKVVFQDGKMGETDSNFFGLLFSKRDILKIYNKCLFYEALTILMVGSFSSSVPSSL